MKENTNTISSYEKLIPKWVAAVVGVIGITLAFFISPSSWAFYFWIIICGLFIYKTLTQKKDENPKLEISETGIKIDNKDFYNFMEITKVMAFSKKRLRFRSISFILYLKNGAQVEFPVDNLDIKPQLILDTINARLIKE